MLSFFLYTCVFCTSKYIFLNIASCPLTGNVESSVPLMLDNDDENVDDNDDITTATAKYYDRQCMHFVFFSILLLHE